MEVWQNRILFWTKIDWPEGIYNTSSKKLCYSNSESHIWMYSVIKFSSQRNNFYLWFGQAHLLLENFFLNTNPVIGNSNNGPIFFCFWNRIFFHEVYVQYCCISCWHLDSKYLGHFFSLSIICASFSHASISQNCIHIHACENDCFILSEPEKKIVSSSYFILFSLNCKIFFKFSDYTYQLI